MASKRTNRVYRVVYKNTAGHETSTPESTDLEGMRSYLAGIHLPTPSIADAWLESREVTDWRCEPYVGDADDPVFDAVQEPADDDPGDK